MNKKYAIALLGGTVTKASKNYGSTSQAISRWKDVLPTSVEAKVVFAFSKLPMSVKRRNKAAAEATK